MTDAPGTEPRPNPWEEALRRSLASRKPLLIRSLDADVHLEIFMVAAVAAILVIRFYLRVTGYPQLGSGSVHVAHMLWGGLLMLVALVLLLTFMNRAAQRLAAGIGGAGFGTFLDEVGKFVTQDNDYFYQPSFALMYVVFVLLAVVGHTILRRTYTPSECLLNAIQEVEELALLDFDTHERGRALTLLDRSDSQHPLVGLLRQIVLDAPIVPGARPGRYARTRDFLRRRYESLANGRHFQIGVIVFFVAQLVLRIVQVVIVVFFPWMLPTSVGGEVVHVAERLQDLRLADWGQLLSTAISGVLVLSGVVGLARSRRFAYRMFKASVLITVFITQFFMFYEEQLSAIIGLGLNLVLLGALQAGLDLERARSTDVAAGVACAPAGASPCG